MKKRGLSVFLISLVIPFIANCNEDSIIGYTYISESEFFISKVRFNSDKSIDVFMGDEWKHISPVIPDKNNLNFIVHRSDNPEFFESLEFDEDEIILLGFLSKDAKTLYMGAGFIFSKEESEKNSHAVTGDIYYTYINGLDNEDLFKVRFNADKSFDIFIEDEWNHIVPVIPDKKNLNFIVHRSDNPEFFESLELDEDQIIFGFLSKDKNTLYMGTGLIFSKEESEKNSHAVTGDTYTEPEFSNPALTVDSIDVGGITFRSTPEDLLIQYPSARVFYADNYTAFFLDGLDHFDEARFVFQDDKLVSISKEKNTAKYEQETAALVQKSVRKLTAKYGKPKVYQSSEKNLGYETHLRVYTWYGEVCIQLVYTWLADEDGNRVYNSIYSGFFHIYYSYP